MPVIDGNPFLIYQNHFKAAEFSEQTATTLEVEVKKLRELSLNLFNDSENQNDIIPIIAKTYNDLAQGFEDHAQECRKDAEERRWLAASVKRVYDPNNNWP